MLRILHCSDLHFGKPSRPEQVAALEHAIATETLSAIVISGDLSQRHRVSELERAARFVRLCEDRAPTVVIPGNHDCRWWTAPMGFGSYYGMFERYRTYIRSDLEPRVSIPGATIVGVNSSHGIQRYTLTTRPRDLSVVGAIRGRQWERARSVFATAPDGDFKVLVMHHNLLRGNLSNRWGLASRAFGIVDAAHTGADLVCCGHDHEERVEEVDVARRKLIVSTAGTLTNRSRGGRPGSWNMIELEDGVVRITMNEWHEEGRAFRQARKNAYVMRRAK
ncbi:MAG: metallophosphoesterase [Gemmatimonadetes bacterium]|nr:metallophosphoesterase [Gemmatimonadota bacterium]